MSYRPVRPPVLTEDDLGVYGWRLFHELADLRERLPRQQVVPLLRYALYRASVGDDVELSHSQLAALRNSQALEPVA